MRMSSHHMAYHSLLNYDFFFGFFSFVLLFRRGEREKKRGGEDGIAKIVRVIETGSR